MKRRLFLKSVLGVSAGLVVTKVIAKPVEFELKPILKDGKPYISTFGEAKVVNRKNGSFAKELWPGIDEWYEEQYSKSLMSIKPTKLITRKEHLDDATKILKESLL
jgi:hypothetical protein